MSNYQRIESALSAHRSIAWDIDQTLVGGKFSNEFILFIQSHPEIEHHLITFRNKDWADEVWSDLKPKMGANVRDLFVDVHNCDEDDWHFFSVRNSPFGGLTGDPEMDTILNAAHDAVMTYKGRKASELGCTILVDDLIQMVHEGCSAYGVSLMNATNGQMVSLPAISK